MDTVIAVNRPKVLDEVVFLASLASDLSKIDPWLDTVRDITGLKNQGEAYTPEEEGKFNEVRTNLENYLLHDDPLRTFTKESLQEKLADQFEILSGHTPPHTRVKHQFEIILGGVGAVFLISAYIFFSNYVDAWWIFAASCSVTAMFISSCWLFLSGYKTFTTNLRKAYAWICAGIITLGFSASLWLVYTSVPTIFTIPILRFGLPYLLFGIAFIITYIGLRIFAKTLSVTSRLLSLKIILPLSLLACVAVQFLPHLIPNEDRYLPTIMIGVALISYYGFVILALAYRIRKHLTTAYARAITLFGSGYGLSATVGIASTVLLLLTGSSFGIKLVIMGIFYACGGMLVFVSGYLFRLSSIGKNVVYATNIQNTNPSTPVPQQISKSP